MQSTAKQELQEFQELLDDIGERVSEMLDPALSREQLVEQIQELDELVNGSEDDPEEEGEAN
jgi:hypothetical protein